ncbi:MAG: response regulator [Opitutia bacterium Tous-C1TDCM]|nr:MAG: response regulator [Opitutae bacterium Tous-C1TDCM]
MNFNGMIMLVDDEPHIRKYVSLILRQLGNPTVVQAGNGEEAIAVYQRENPDLVLMDVNMPQMDGIATLKRLKEIDPNAVVIMLTSLANRETIEQALELGAANYIRKDTPREEIAKSLAETIDACFDLG